MEPEFDDLIWNRNNLNYIRRHGGSRRVCYEVFRGKPRLFKQEGRTATHQMIGPDRGGRFWTISLIVKGDRTGLPINAWPSNQRDIRKYEEAETND